MPLQMRMRMIREMMRRREDGGDEDVDANANGIKNEDVNANN